ncbi:uncharacterized protein LOC123720416 [Pieris brassicae]|uniref:uncharacterized protein LOC123720416 n=1 Tax=Pieris brassicae TaxID=7116 RepID=UPI001E65E5CF|nr:uncharacterized protein LOC123720416 [Pieris brassicae]
MNTCDELRFEKIFQTMLKAMRLNKTHPNIPRDKKWFLKFIIMYGIFMLGISFAAYSTFFHDLKDGNFSQACYHGVLIVIFTVVSLYHIVMGWHRFRFQDLINQMKEDYDVAKHFAVEDYNVVLDYAKRGKMIMYTWLALALSCVIIHQLSAILPMVHNAAMTGEFQCVHLYNITYPGNLEIWKNETSVCLSLFALFTYGYIYAVIMYIAGPALGPILMLHGCGQLELVRRRIAETYSKRKKGFEVHNLKLAAKHLSMTYNFMKKTNESLQMFHEIIFKAVIVILPILFYQLKEGNTNREMNIEIIGFVFGATLLCGLPCYYGDLLMEKTNDIKMALYSCGWEHHVEREPRTLILLLMIRVDRPVGLSTMFLDICLEQLTDIYRQAYALFNLLIAVLD